MAKTEKEKLHLIHTVIGVIVAVILIALIVMGFIATGGQSEEQTRQRLDERYQEKLENCYNTALAYTHLLEQEGESDISKYPYCQKEYIEDENGHAKGVVIYYYQGLSGGREEYFNSLKDSK